jgi:DNA-binding NarL/FixJ family response regulator
VWTMSGTEDRSRAHSGHRTRRTITTASECGFNRWVQHTGYCASRRSVADEAKTPDLLHETQKALMWERCQKGESLQQIAQLFDRNHSPIQRILAETGGIRPTQRRRSRLALTLAEREEISRAVVAGHSIRSIARLLGRSPTPGAVVAAADCRVA